MCNAYNHSPDCDCGFGGDTGGGWRFDPVRSSWQYRDHDFCRPTTCPHCGAQVFFVRHNGGSVWFDELGAPWDKHACFADDGYGSSLRGGLRSAPALVQPAFGVVIETVRYGPYVSDRVVVRRSDGIVSEVAIGGSSFALGQLVVVSQSGGQVALTPVTPYVEAERGSGGGSAVAMPEGLGEASALSAAGRHIEAIRLIEERLASRANDVAAWEALGAAYAAWGAMVARPARVLQIYESLARLDRDAAERFISSIPEPLRSEVRRANAGRGTPIIHSIS